MEIRTYLLNPWRASAKFHRSLYTENQSRLVTWRQMFYAHEVLCGHFSQRESVRLIIDMIAAP